MTTERARDIVTRLMREHDLALIGLSSQEVKYVHSEMYSFYENEDDLSDEEE